MDNANLERRAHARVSASLLVKIANDDGSFDEYITRDISMGGIFIQTNRFRDIGDDLELLLCFVDGQEEIAVLGEVVRVIKSDEQSKGVPGPIGMGIRFNVVEPKLKDELKQFLDSLLELTGAGTREHHRVKARLSLKLKFEGNAKKALLNDISKGGLFLETDEDFNLTDRIEINLVHPTTGERVDTVGEIVHKKEWLDKKQQVRQGIGVRFIDMTDEKKKLIAQFITGLVKGLQEAE